MIESIKIISTRFIVANSDESDCSIFFGAAFCIRALHEALEETSGFSRSPIIISENAKARKRKIILRGGLRFEKGGANRRGESTKFGYLLSNDIQQSS